MVDRFGAHNLTPKRPLPPLPDDFVEWKGMRVPRALEFRWQDLVRVAAINGLPLSQPLLHKWRDWRFLPPPRAGGPLARGPGKGQIWSKVAGRLVAWISYWRNRRLTYDTLRLAMWPWKHTFDRERLTDVLASLRRFVVWDEKFQSAVLHKAERSGTRNEELDAYASVLFAWDEPPIEEHRDRLLRSTPLPREHPEYESTREFLTHLTFDELQKTTARLKTEDVAIFIQTFRQRMGPHQQRLSDELWEDPLRVARIVVRNLQRYALATRAEGVSRLETQ